MWNATRSLLIVWASLMTLTLLMAFAGDVVGPSHPGALGIGVIAGVAALKSRIILRSYLGLVRAPAAATGFFTVVFVLLALVAASFLIFPTPAQHAASHSFAQVSGGTE
jgi:hypothetical protein